jgi:hypothetical protein
MSNKPRFISVLPEIIRVFTATGKGVFNKKDISDIFEQYKDKWRLPLYMGLDIFMDQLAGQSFIKEAVLEFPEVNTGRLFYFDSATIYEIASTIFSKGYLSHYSATSIWGLTEQIPKTIYVTIEQSNSPSKLLARENDLVQKNIDAAFSKPQRQSETTAILGDYKIVLLRGKFTKNLGVVKFSKTIAVTDLERSLIDIVVRPSYSGGISEVIKAFRIANSEHKVSINKLSGYLNRLEFIYPYHQAIGFYLEAAGNYKPSQISIFSNREMKNDFYLAYDMKLMSFSEKWRIWYPTGLI